MENRHRATRLVFLLAFVLSVPQALAECNAWVGLQSAGDSLIATSAGTSAAGCPIHFQLYIGNADGTAWNFHATTSGDPDWNCTGNCEYTWVNDPVSLTCMRTGTYQVRSRTLCYRKIGFDCILDTPGHAEVPFSTSATPSVTTTVGPLDPGTGKHRIEINYDFPHNENNDRRIFLLLNNSLLTEWNQTSGLSHTTGIVSYDVLPACGVIKAVAIACGYLNDPAYTAQSTAVITDDTCKWRPRHSPSRADVEAVSLQQSIH